MLSRQKVLFAILLAIPIFLLSGVAGSVAHAVEAAPPAPPAPAAPKAAPEAPSNLTELEAGSIASTDDLSVIGCTGWGTLGPSCWIPVGAYYLAYIPAMTLLTLSGYIFDYTLSLSIDKVFINQQFVEDTWTVVRDFSNMIFIFILLYTGIRTMFGIGEWKKTIINIVIIALVINFSLFFSRVIIDAGNILAVGVYEGMGVVKNDIDRPHKPEKKDDIPLVRERNISATLVNAFAPQKFTTLASKADKSFATTIFLISAIVSFYVAWVFIKASFMFVGRLIAFWFFMIISPFALISMVLPKGNIFDFWLYGLINQAFVAPVFLFMVYIIMMAVGTGGGILSGFGNPSGSGFFFDVIFVPIVITGMIIYALQKALSLAKSTSGAFGEIGAKAASAVLSSFPVGMGANLALGGAARILRSTVGQGASKALDSGVLRRMSTTGNFAQRALGRGLMGLAEKAEKSSLDIRQTGAVKKGLGTIKSELGVNINLGEAEKLGWKKLQEKQEKEDTRRAKRAEVSASEKAAKAAAINPEYADAKARVEREYQAEREATFTHQKARERAGRTKEAEDVRTADSKRSSLKMEGDNLAKKIERLNEELKNAETGLAQVLQDEILRAEADQKAIKNYIKESEDKFTEAEKTFKNTKEYAEIAAAEKAIKTASGKIKATRKIIEDTEKDLYEWENSENERRRERTARDLASLRLYIPKADREARVKKIRDEKKKKTKEERKKEKEEEDLLKKWKKMVEKKDKKEEVSEGEEGEKKDNT